MSSTSRLSAIALLMMAALAAWPKLVPVATVAAAGRLADGYATAVGPSPLSSQTYDLTFSTYLGGSGYEHARDVFVDSQGNVYVTGGTASRDFPTTPGAYDRTFDDTGTQIGSAGLMDIFVTKFDPNGHLLWSTYLGGPNYDRAYAIEVDHQGYVYLAGRAGPGFPTTPGAFQPSFQGSDAGIYGMQNGFVAKLSPDGSNLVWASYVGVGHLCRDMALDDSGNVYVPLGYDGVGGTPSSQWFTNAFQKTLQGGTDSGAIKIKADGSQVLWATWLGGSGDDSGAASIRVDDHGYVYLVIYTFSGDIPTSSLAHDRTYNGAADYYVAKLTPDGSDLLFGTYLGGSGNEWLSTHNLALDDQGNVYVSVWTNSTNFPTTSGAFQTTYGGGISDMAIAKLSTTGALIASTFLGGSSPENPDGLYVDASSNVFITGQSASTDFPVTADAYQSTSHGGGEAVLLTLSADFSHPLYSTYLGGSSDDDGRAGFLTSDGSMLVTGQTSSPGWPTKDAFQSSFNGGPLDCVLAKLTPLPTPDPPTRDSISYYLPLVHRAWHQQSVAATPS